MSKKLFVGAILAMGVLFGCSAAAFAADTYADTTGHWAEDAIIEWSGENVLNGYNGNFRPDDSITRGEMAAILHRIMQYSEIATNTFTDLDNSAWYTDAVLRANAAGVMLGDGVGGMRPTDTITRQEAIVMIARALGLANLSYSSTVPFSDGGSISSWALADITIMYEKGYIDWAGTAAFNPNTPITRAEVVATLDNIIENMWRSNGLYCDYIDGSALVSANKAYLHNSYINGNIIIGGGAQKVVIDNCIVNGSIITVNNAEVVVLDQNSAPTDYFYFGDYDIPILAGVAENNLSAFYFAQENGRTIYTDPAIETRAGIDISEWQSDIDWQRVANDGIDFAIIRLGYRGYTEGKLNLDINFIENMEEALDSGLDVGVYFFSQAITEQEAIEEAQMCIDYLRNYDITYPVVFDWETVNSASARTNNINGTVLTNCAIAFCETIENAGYEAMIYANKELSLRTLDLSRLTDYPFWFAGYTTYPEFYYGFDMWQYTSDGSVNGIEGRVDMNIEFIY